MSKYRILEVKNTSQTTYRVQKKRFNLFWDDDHYHYGVFKTNFVKGMSLEKAVLNSFKDLITARLYKLYLEGLHQSFTYNGMLVESAFTGKGEIYYCVYYLHFGFLYSDYSLNFFKNKEEAIEWIDNNYPRKISSKVVS